LLPKVAQLENCDLGGSATEEDGSNPSISQ
jgi:hypothetical protein